MKTLLLYYSYGGNTRRVAQHIQNILGCDVAEISTVTPYSGSYNFIVDQGKREVDSGYEPSIRPIDKNIKDYDTVILGTCVWWYTFAPAVKTMLSAVDWKGKTVYPFATNGGWIGHTFKDIEKACSGAEVKMGLNIRFDENQMRTSMTDIDRWIGQIAKD